jgi:hypothetical protein
VFEKSKSVTLVSLLVSILKEDFREGRKGTDKDWMAAARADSFQEQSFSQPQTIILLVFYSLKFTHYYLRSISHSLKALFPHPVLSFSADCRRNVSEVWRLAETPKM